MQRDNDHKTGRRPLLMGAGVTLGALGGLTSPVTAGKGNGNGRSGQNGRGKRPLEASPSLVAYMDFQGAGTQFHYPDGNPAFVPYGLLFDTTSAEITPNGKVLHYQLQFGANSKPYVLLHSGGGRYISRGSVINFGLNEGNNFGLPEGKYRATVRDKVQLYDRGGYFDWSVTRTDIFARPGMVYAGSSLIIVWDEDGSENGDKSVRNPWDGSSPEFSKAVLGEDTFSAIDEAARELITAGPSNPGG